MTGHGMHVAHDADWGTPAGVFQARCSCGWMGDWQMYRPTAIREHTVHAAPHIVAVTW